MKITPFTYQCFIGDLVDLLRHEASNVRENYGKRSSKSKTEFSNAKFLDGMEDAYTKAIEIWESEAKAQQIPLDVRFEEDSEMLPSTEQYETYMRNCHKKIEAESDDILSSDNKTQEEEDYQTGHFFVYENILKTTYLDAKIWELPLKAIGLQDVTFLGYSAFLDGCEENYKEKSDKEIYESINSHKKNIEKHENLIRDPETYLKKYKTHSKYRNDTLKKWAKGIQRAEDQIDILEGVLRNRK